MQTTFYPLSGKHLFVVTRKLLLPMAVIAFGLLLLFFSKKSNSPEQLSKIPPHKDFSSIVTKMYDAKGRIRQHHIASTSNSPSDENQLKQSDWFKAVQQDIDKRMYDVVQEKEKAFRSFNNAQGLRTSYHGANFELEPLPLTNKKELKKEWKLNIDVTGLYADNKLLNKPNEQIIGAESSNNDIEYNLGKGFLIQYHNDIKGIRQNFIINEKPSANVQKLKIGMRAEADWVVNKVHDHEIHFAKKNSAGKLESKIVYNDLKAWDANGKSLSAKIEVGNDNNFDIVTNVENAAYPITIDPLSSAPSSTFNGSSTNSLFGGSIASAGDVNGDGYSDIIVGAPETSGFVGAVYIYLGSASGLSSSAATTLTGVSVGNDFGVSVANIGDINGDGFSDVIIGATGVSGSAGAAYIFLGSASGIASGTSASASATLTGISSNDNFGISVANAGDINGDGFSDVVIGAYKVSNIGAAYIFLGSASGIASGSASTASATLNGAAVNDAFGISVSSAGDVNGDSYSDVIVGAYGHNLGTGAAYIYLGSSTGIANNASASAILNGVSATGAFGGSVSSAGDVNGDGYSDVIIGASSVSTNTGAAYIYQGSSSGIANNASPSTTLSGVSSGDRFGFSVAGAGDMNGDAFADVIIGAIGVSSGTGAAYVFEGNSAGISNTAAPAAIWKGINTGDSYGFAVASAGDINGDGISDALAGAPNASTSTGALYTYSGNPDASVNPSNVSIVGQNAGDRYGLSVATAGDVNGDGYSDVIIGAIGYNGITGAAYIYYGSAAGLSLASPTLLTIPAPSSGNQPNYGWSVAGAGDINGDGYDDVIVGVKFQNDNNSGAAFIYLGSASGIPSNSDGTSASAVFNGLNSYDYYGGSVASAGDVNGDGYSDVIIGAPGASITG